MLLCAPVCVPVSVLGSKIGSLGTEAESCSNRGGERVVCEVLGTWGGREDPRLPVRLEEFGARLRSTCRQ